MSPSGETPAGNDAGTARTPDPAGTTGEITRLLRQWSGGNTEARERLLELVYQNLRGLARRRLRRERRHHTLQTTDLVHEAYLRLVGQTRLEWQSRRHFFAVAAQAMRRILLDHERRRRAGKRIGPGDKVPMEAVPEPAVEPGIDLIHLDEALGKLARIDRRQVLLVELRFFAGLTIRDTALVLGISPATVKREWQLAQAWLRRAMAG